MTNLTTVNERLTGDELESQKLFFDVYVAIKGDRYVPKSPTYDLEGAEAFGRHWSDFSELVYKQNWVNAARMLVPSDVVQKITIHPEGVHISVQNGSHFLSEKVGCTRKTLALAFLHIAVILAEAQSSMFKSHIIWESALGNDGPGSGLDVDLMDPLAEWGEEILIQNNTKPDFLVFGDEWIHHGKWAGRKDQDVVELSYFDGHKQPDAYIRANWQLPHGREIMTEIGITIEAIRLKKDHPHYRKADAS